MQKKFAGFCCGHAAAAYDDDENWCPKLASISLSTTVPRCLASTNGHMSALNPVVLPASAVALAASLSWRCFMEWKTRCAPAVAVSRRFFSPFSSLRFE